MPGPDSQKPGEWSFGVCNPSGLQRKAMLLSGIQADLIAVSETHLTAVSKSMLQQSLRAHSTYTHEHVYTCCHMYTHGSSDAGQYSGVALVSKLPSRALCSNWPPDLFETGRVQIVGTRSQLLGHSSLLITKRATITAVDNENVAGVEMGGGRARDTKQSLIHIFVKHCALAQSPSQFDPPTTFCANVPIQLASSLVPIVHATEDKLFLAQEINAVLFHPSQTTGRP